jgi:uncharacterized Zn finger protein
MDSLGCKCEACGCDESEVRKTTRVTGGTLRVRACKNCGAMYPTMEYVLKTKKEFSEKNSP